MKTKSSEDIERASLNAANINGYWYLTKWYCIMLRNGIGIMEDF